LSEIEAEFGKVANVKHVVTILHDGWESDNRGWVCRMADGSVQAFTTNHGGVCRFTSEDVESYIDTTKQSLTSLVDALDMLNS
jgi:hypothetical protein